VFGEHASDHVRMAKENSDRGFRHGQLVVVINGGVRTCETYAALSVTVMLTRFPTLESILTSRSMVNL
jgi:glucan phosphoethanolaminetransferase (alkaline phosphatase superfamily)